MNQKNILILDKEFILYCELNEIKDIDKLAIETFNRGFSLLKYGETPMGTSREIIKEVPVEIIVEKEIIRKVPVEKIVEREVIVEKEIKVPYEVEVIKEIIKEVPVEVIKEVIKEIRVEVPIEVIKEGETKTVVKEIIKEVPIEVIKEVIKEITVEKIVEVIKEVPVDRVVEKEIIKEVINTKQIDELTKENDKLKQEMAQITKALDGMNKAKFLKKSDLSDLYDE
jgi:hypothetical protein